MGRPGRSSSRSQSHSNTRASHAPAPMKSASPPSVAPTQAPVPAQSGSGGGGGFFSNVLQTATGVAIGHTMGHALTGLLGGHPTTAAPSAPAEMAAPSSATYCEPHLKSFMDCMEKQHQDVSACQFYLDMLKQCRMGSSSGDVASSHSSSPAW